MQNIENRTHTVIVSHKQNKRSSFLLGSLSIFSLCILLASIAAIVGSQLKEMYSEAIRNFTVNNVKMEPFVIGALALSLAASFAVFAVSCMFLIDRVKNRTTHITIEDSSASEYGNDPGLEGSIKVLSDSGPAVAAGNLASASASQHRIHSEHEKRNPSTPGNPSKSVDGNTASLRNLPQQMPIYTGPTIISAKVEVHAIQQDRQLDEGDSEQFRGEIAEHRIIQVARNLLKNSKSISISDKDTRDLQEMIDAYDNTPEWREAYSGEVLTFFQRSKELSRFLEPQQTIDKSQMKSAASQPITNLEKEESHPSTSTKGSTNTRVVPHENEPGQGFRDDDDTQAILNITETTAYNAPVMQFMHTSGPESIDSDYAPSDDRPIMPLWDDVIGQYIGQSIYSSEFRSINKQPGYFVRKWRKELQGTREQQLESEISNDIRSLSKGMPVSSQDAFLQVIRYFAINQGSVDANSSFDSDSNPKSPMLNFLSAVKNFVDQAHPILLFVRFMHDSGYSSGASANPLEVLHSLMLGVSAFTQTAHSDNESIRQQIGKLHELAHTISNLTSTGNQYESSPWIPSSERIFSTVSSTVASGIASATTYMARTIPSATPVTNAVSRVATAIERTVSANDHSREMASDILTKFFSQLDIIGYLRSAKNFTEGSPDLTAQLPGNVRESEMSGTWEHIETYTPPKCDDLRSCLTHLQIRLELVIKVLNSTTLIYDDPTRSAVLGCKNIPDGGYALGTYLDTKFKELNNVPGLQIVDTSAMDHGINTSLKDGMRI